MNKTFKKYAALFLSVIVLFSVSPFAFAGNVKTTCGGSGNCDTAPSIVIPGLFQSETYALDEDGNPLLDSDGNVRTGPFFMDTDEVIIDAIKTALLPLAETLITQKDGENKFGNALGDVLGKALMDQVRSDENGKPVHNCGAVKYETSMAELSQHDREWAYGAIPVQGYAAQAGEDHLYFFSYNSFGNIIDIADELYDLIQQVKAETGHDKVNIVPISQGGAVFNALLEFHKEVINDLNRIIYIVPAIDGSDVIGDIYAYGLNDSDDALYGYMIPSLLKDQEWLGYLANILLRLFPKETLNSILDIAVDKLISDYLINTTAIWALIPQDSYLIAREKYLLGQEHDEIRRQTDLFYQAQVNAHQNILDARNAGVTVFDICGYNKTLYSIAKSWDKENADGIIQLDSTSLGSTSAPVDGKLPDGYVQQNTHIADGTCSDPSHNHIDPYFMVDASTGLLPDNTFYFYGQNHETTGRCDTIINLAVRLLIDETFTSVYSYPEEYSQFNNFVLMRGFRNDVAAMKRLLLSGNIPEEYVEKVEKAIEEAEAALAMTNIDLEKYNAAYESFYAVREEILMLDEDYASSKAETEKKNFFEKVFSFIMKIVNNIIRRFFGDKGFSE